MAAAQQGSTAYVTRSELESYAARVERAAANGGGDQQRAEATALRRRLREGDFQVGDKIILYTTSAVGLPDDIIRTLNDTVTVRDGQIVRLPNMADVQLAGVLRSEIDSVMNAAVARSLKTVHVVAEPVVQVLVSGPVASPGYHSVTPDTRLSDVIMTTAVPGSTADFNKTKIVRNGKTVVGADSLRSAIVAGATLDRIDYRPGDEIVVGEKPQGGRLTRFLQIAGLVTSAAFLVLTLTRRR